MPKNEITIEHLSDFHRWLENGTVTGKAKHRLECILAWLEKNMSMSEAASAFGTTPNALRRWLNAFDPTDPSTLEEKSRRPHAVRTTQLPAAVIAHIRDYRTLTPKIGKEEIVRKLKAEQNVDVSASSVARVIESECLYFADSALHRRKRLQALMPSDAPANVTLSETAEVTSVLTPHFGGHLKKKKWMVTTIAISLLLLAGALSHIAYRETVDASMSKPSVNMSVPIPEQQPLNTKEPLHLSIPNES